MGHSADYGLVARRQGKRLFVWVVGLLVVVAVVAVLYVSTPYHGTSESIATVEADDRVTLTRTDGGFVLQPAGVSPDVGVVFYPGARVHPDAYVGSLAPLARAANVIIVVPKLPLNLAAVDYTVGGSGLGTHAATTAMSAHPSVEAWYVGGHSLGGAMACRYARTNPDVDGVLLYASYCDVDVSDSDLAVLSVAGDADTVLNWAAYERGRDNLPPSARVEVLAGVNHSQFGTYRGQDEPSGTSYETAHDRLNGVAVPWLRNETTAGSRALTVPTSEPAPVAVGTADSNGLTSIV